MIESVNNDKVKYLSKLKDKKYRDVNREYVVEGVHVIEEAIKYGYLKELYIMEDNINIDFDNKIIVSESVMKKITSTDNPPKVAGLCRYIDEKESSEDTLVLDGIKDPGNMGTIIRSCKAFNINNIFIGEDSIDIYNPKVIRATEGMIFSLNISRGNVCNKLNSLINDGFTIYRTDVEGGTLLNDITFKDKVAIIIGSEAKGVSTDVKNIEAEKLYIEMNKTCESLNAGVAASIILYEHYIQKNI